MASRGIPARFTPHIYLPDGALDNWRAALATAGSAQVPVVCLGDSITQGQDATSWRTTSWYALLKAALQNRYGNAGQFVGIVDSVAFNASTPVADRVWTFTGTAWSAYNMIGPMGLINGVTNDKATYASLDTYTDFDVLVSQVPGSTTFNVLVDTVQQAGSPTWQNATRTRRVTYPYSGFAATTHTVDVKLAANGLGWLSGIRSYPTGRSTPGILMVKHAKGGITTGVLANNFPTLDPTFWSVTGTIADWSPKLVIIELGINDANALVGYDLYRYHLAAACQSAQSVGASIVILGAYCGSGNINQNYWSNYLSVMRTVAESFNAVFINVHSNFGTASGLLSGPAIHPNDPGHLAMAGLLESVLL